MTKLQELYTQRTALYNKLQKQTQKYQKIQREYRIQRQKIGNELEDLKDLIAVERGEIALSSPKEYIDTNDLAEWLRAMYAGSDALALIAATQVRKDYQNYTGEQVNIHAFRRAMRELGFENKTVRVVNGGGYVARVWVRGTSS